MKYDAAVIKNAIKRFRYQSQWMSTDDFAAKLNIHPRQLGYIMYDEHRSVTDVVAKRIADGMGISVDDFERYGSDDPIRCEVCGTKLNRYHMDTRCYLHEEAMTDNEVKAMVGHRGLHEREQAAA